MERLGQGAKVLSESGSLRSSNPKGINGFVNAQTQQLTGRYRGSKDPFGSGRMPPGVVVARIDRSTNPVRNLATEYIGGNQVPSCLILFFGNRQGRRPLSPG